MQDGVVYVNPYIHTDWMKKDPGFHPFGAQLKIPEGAGAGAGRISDPAMAEFKAKGARACVDKLVCTRHSHGAPMALLGLRDSDQPFGGKLWMQGGQLRAYGDLLAFAASRGEAECGVGGRAEVLIGVFYTSAEDHPSSTIQPCYASYVPYDKVLASMQADHNHRGGLLLVSLAELRAVTDDDYDKPGSPWHRYPVLAATLALEHMPQF